MTDNKLDKIADILSALVEENAILRNQMGDVLAQRKDYAADIRDLKSAIDTTRRALDPSVLGEHVAGNIDTIMGDTSQALIAATKANIEIANKTINIPEKLTKQIEGLGKKEERLERIANEIEENVERRSKWDFGALAIAMAITAILAGTTTYFIAKNKLSKANFNDSIARIQNDKNADWCKISRGQVIQNSDKSAYFCAIQMAKYQGGEGE